MVNASCTCLASQQDAYQFFQMAHITGGFDKVARVWSFQDGRAAVEAEVLNHEAAVRSCAVAPDALSVFTACADDAGRLWDLSMSSL